MSNRLSFVILMCLVLASCIPKYSSGPDVSTMFQIVDTPTTPLVDSSQAVMNGVYEVVQGTDVLGKWVVGKWIQQPHRIRWSMYSQDDVYFAECAGGSSGDSIKLVGYIRQVRSGSVFQANFKILNNDGAKEVFEGVIPSRLVIQGTLDDGRTIELKRSRSLHIDPTFQILAHQCGGRNSDRLGYSENSIPMIEHAAIFGATGIEMDVRFTRDKYVIVFHDNTFSPRTVQGTYLLGDVKNFDLAQIQSLGRLLDGEAIPTLRNALTAVVLETNLSLVWLDVKDAAAVDSIINIQKDIMDFALFNGRDVNVLMGIPNGADDVRTSYLTSQNPNKSAVGFLTEKDDEELLALPNCQAWAPYWAEVTEGRIQDVKSRFNKKVFIWTVDLHDRIRDYVYGVGGAPDGILTNYSPLARGIHDSQ